MTFQIGANVLDTVPEAAYATSGLAFGLGDRLTVFDGREFVYVQADGAITGPGFVCSISPAYQAVMLSTANDARGNIVGVPLVAFADNEYGWLQVKGPCAAVRVAGLAAANVRLNTTATAGQIDDDGTGGSMQVQGVYLTATNGASAGTVAGILNYPFIDVTL